MASPQLFKATISDVRGALYDGAVLSLHLPGNEGEMTVLAHHEPIIALLKPGVITLNDEKNQKHEFTVTKGVLEVSNNKAIVLL